MPRLNLRLRARDAADGGTCNPVLTNAELSSMDDIMFQLGELVTHLECYSRRMVTVPGLPFLLGLDLD